MVTFADIIVFLPFSKYIQNKQLSNSPQHFLTLCFRCTCICHFVVMEAVTSGSLAACAAYVSDDNTLAPRCLIYRVAYSWIPE